MVLKITRILCKVILWTLLMLIVFFLVADRLVQFRMDDEGLQGWFHSRKLEPAIHYFESNGRKVRYIEVGREPERLASTGGPGRGQSGTGPGSREDAGVEPVVKSRPRSEPASRLSGDDPGKATVLFIHGAPSSLSYWKGYLSDTALLKRAVLYAVDRPGYGYSGLGDPLPDMSQQAAIIKLILDSLNRVHRPVVVVGASYGAPIACRLAMDYPQLVDGLVLVAPPLGPGQERIFWFTYMIENPLIHWIVPRMLQSANREKVYHKEELNKLLPLWPRIHTPVIYLQGKNDELVFPTNAEFARKHLVNATSLDIQLIPGRGHLLAFSEKERITKAIQAMLDKCGAGR